MVQFGGSLLSWERHGRVQPRNPVLGPDRALLALGPAALPPDCNGPVFWSLAYSFFRINQNDVEEGRCQEINEETTAIKAEGAASCESS